MDKPPGGASLASRGHRESVPESVTSTRGCPTRDNIAQTPEQGREPQESQTNVTPRGFEDDTTLARDKLTVIVHPSESEATFLRTHATQPLPRCEFRLGSKDPFLD